MGAVANLGKFLNPNNSRGIIVVGLLTLLSVVHPLLGILALLVTAVLCQARENYGVLEKCGIPVMKPTLFLGSEPNFHKTVLHLEDIERFNKYGGIWGSYVGRSPTVFIADPELMRLIMVKDFVYFGDRQHVDFGCEIMNEVLDYLPGEKWTTVRTNLSPLFTTSKLNKMSDVIAESAAEFVGELRSECDEQGRLKVDCRKRLSTWLIDMFTNVIFGLRLEDSKNPDNKFAQAFRDMLGEHSQHTWMYTLALSFPMLVRFAPSFDPEPTKLIESTFRQIIDSRRKSGKSSAKDFLDVLCEFWDKIPTKEYQDLGITETTVLAQAVNFFLGGFETTSSTLTHLFLYMAEDPEMQDKMYEEVMEVLSHTQDSRSGAKSSSLEINHDVVEDSKLPYILACINETLRLAPSVHRTERICTKDWTHNGISIKKGTLVMFPTWAANRNPKSFPDDPTKFKPERFFPEAKAKLSPYALTTFGFGPRHCIGMRFAYENMKLFMCNFVKNFRIEKRADTQMIYKTAAYGMVGFSPVYLDLVLRD